MEKTESNKAKEQQDWYKENYQYGIDLGYPECCVKAFCVLSPAVLKLIKDKKNMELRYKASFMNDKYTGLIPCSKHAQLILDGKIKISDLINNRKVEIPFPNLW